MSYTLTLDLGGLPEARRAVVRSVLSEYEVKVSTYGDVLDVTSRDEETTREACRVAAEKAGKTLDELVINLFA